MFAQCQTVMEFIDVNMLGVGKLTILHAINR